MSSIKIQIRLKLTTSGVPLSKLASITENTQEFLIEVGKQVKLDLKPEKWLAHNFKNSDLTFVPEYSQDIAEKNARDYNRVMKMIMNEKILANPKILYRRKSAMIKYNQIGSVLNKNEAIEFGIYNNGGSEPQVVYRLSKQDFLIREHELNKLDEIKYSENAMVTDTFEYIGEIRGAIHAWFIETDQENPYIKVRNFQDNELINCYYSKNMYEKIQSLTDYEGREVLINGFITANQKSRKIVKIDVKAVDLVEQYHEGDLEKFLGCAPDLKGGLSTEEYIRIGRNE